MIQDIYPSKLHNEFRPDACACPESPVLCFRGSEMLVKAPENAGGGKLIFPSAGQLKDAGMTDDPVYGFCVDDTEYYLDPGDRSYDLSGYAYQEIRRIRAFAENTEGMIAFTGYHLSQWYRDSRFCGTCGTPLVHDQGERAMVCPGCGKKVYPRLNPAVIVGVIDGERLLVTQYNTGFAHFALIAGFSEIGETLEETVAREVMEEAGLKVKNIRYYKSQPWGIAQDLLAGFYCEVDGDNTIRMDRSELKLAQFRTREEIVLQPDSFSLTNEMMKMFKDGVV